MSSVLVHTVKVGIARREDVSLWQVVQVGGQCEILRLLIDVVKSGKKIIYLIKNHAAWMFKDICDNSAVKQHKSVKY